MKTSANGRAFIEVFEGLYLHTYDDGAGYLTIGYGHTTAAGPPKVVAGMRITEAEADAILERDLAAVEVSVQRAIKQPMTQAQFDALVSFEFNTGALAKGTIDDKINRGDVDAAMATLLQYDKAGGRVMAGLVRRRKAERLMYLGQVEAAMKLAGARMQTEPANPPPDPVPAPQPAPVQPPSVWGGFFNALINLFRRSK